MTRKPFVEVGYGKKGLKDYKYWIMRDVVGIDVTAKDGLGNKIEVNLREDGYRLTLNGETLRLV